MTSIGRPARYNEEIAQRILDRLTTGHSLRTACLDAGIAHTTVLQWVREDRDGFATRYREARRTGGGPTTCPTCYTAGIAERILQQLSDGRSLVEISGDPGMPSASTVRRWAAEDRDGFAARFQHVREIIGSKAGRPTRYENRIADEILDELSSGRSLVSVCADPDMPAHPTVRRWAAEDRDGFGARYRRARQLGCDAIADRILKIADERDCWIEHPVPDGKTDAIFDDRYVERARLRTKARCWLLSKMLPRKFGGRTRGTLNKLGR
jgi:hypothetical protein